METILKSITRPMSINGNGIEDSKISILNIISSLESGKAVKIFIPKIKQEASQIDTVDKAPTANSISINHTYIIKVRQYMTKPTSSEFDFHEKWNNNVPMPFRVMQGRVLKETRGMVMMECHVVPINTDNCIRCGRALTHPVSKLYGIGPECGGHAHINPYHSEQELYEALDTIKAKLSEITWRGWVIKSAIQECQEVR